MIFQRQSTKSIDEVFFQLGIVRSSKTISYASVDVLHDKTLPSSYTSSLSINEQSLKSYISSCSPTYSTKKLKNIK